MFGNRIFFRFCSGFQSLKHTTERNASLLGCLQHRISLSSPRNISTTAHNRLKEIRETVTSTGIVVEGVTIESDKKDHLFSSDGTSSKACPLCRLNLDLEHTDVLILSQFVKLDGNMLSRRVTGLCEKQQKLVSALVDQAKKAGKVFSKSQMNGFVNCDVTQRINTRRLKVIDLNPHLMCVLCGGYYIDATTIIECLHSFCKTCIVRYLETSKFCPICDVQVHKTKPLLNIRSDQTLQDIVYKLVPGLFQREMKRRREFYAKQPPDVLKNVRSNEERGEVDNDFPHHIFVPDEFISVALEYSEIGGTSNGAEIVDKKNTTFKRYLKCPVVITVAHIKKLIRAKYGLSTEHRVDLMFSRDCLSDDFTIMDIAYTYSWKRKGPLKLFFRIYERPCKRLKTFHNPSLVPLFGAEAGKNDPSEPNEPAGQSVKDEGKVEKKESPELLKLEPVVNGVKDEKCMNVSVKDEDEKKKKEKCSVISDDKKNGLVEKKTEVKVCQDVKTTLTENKKETKVESEVKKMSDCLVVALIEKSTTNVELVSKCNKMEENNNNDSQHEKKEVITNGEVTKEQKSLSLPEKVNGVVTANGKDDIRKTEIKTT